MSGALNSFSTFAVRVGGGGAAAPEGFGFSCGCAATTPAAKAVLMNSLLRIIFTPRLPRDSVYRTRPCPRSLTRLEGLMGIAQQFYSHGWVNASGLTAWDASNAGSLPHHAAEHCAPESHFRSIAILSTGW